MFKLKKYNLGKQDIKKIMLMKKVLSKPNKIIFNYNNEEFVVSSMLKLWENNSLCIFSTLNSESIKYYSSLDTLLENHCLFNRKLIDCFRDVQSIAYTY